MRSPFLVASVDFGSSTKCSSSSTATGNKHLCSWRADELCARRPLRNSAGKRKHHDRGRIRNCSDRSLRLYPLYLDTTRGDEHHPQRLLGRAVADRKRVDLRWNKYVR